MSLSTLYDSAEITCITLQAEEGFATTVDSAGAVTLWDLSTGLPKTLLQTFQCVVKCARLANGILTIVVHNPSHSLEPWKISVWNVEAKKEVRTTRLPNIPNSSNDDFTISEDGTTLFSVGESKIRAWCTLTGEETRWREYQPDPDENPSHATSDHPGHSELVPKFQLIPTRVADQPAHKVVPVRFPPLSPESWRESAFRVAKLPVRGWDASQLDPALPVQRQWGENIHPGKIFYVVLTGGHAYLATKSLHLNPIGGIPLLKGIQMGVFQLPKQSKEPIKARWDGRYLFVAYEGRDTVILDLARALSR